MRRTALCLAVAMIATCGSTLSARDWSKSLRTVRAIQPQSTTGGTIAGHVMSASGSPLAQFTVCVVDTVSFAFIACSADTAADGAYSVMSVPAGTYYLDAFGDGVNEYLDTWYPNTWDSDFWRNLLPAQPIVVSDGATTTIDFRLQPGAHVNVSLRDASGAPIIVPVQLSPRGNPTGFHHWGRVYFDYNGAKYLENGSFAGPDLGNGTYQTYATPIGRTLYVEAWPQGSQYVPVFYDGKPTLDAATPIHTTSDVPVPITITLSAIGGTIQGSFSFSVPQDQILGVVVTLYDSTRHSVQSVNGNINGTYTIGGIPAGTYFIGIQVGAKKSGVTKNYTKFYSNAVDVATATPIQVSSGGNVSGINVVMDSAASVPPVVSFTASPSTIRSGQSSTLTWSTQGTTSVQIDQGLGSQRLSGSVTVSPTTKTTYTLTATQGSTTITSTVTVDVIATPIVNVTSLPAPMIESAGSGGATTSYALTNSGGAPASINLTQTGSFFTQSPASFSLAPGATQVITITASAQAAGSYDGTSIVGNGVPDVPVKLLSAAPPTGNVTAEPNANRVDVAAASGTNPTGSITFTNNGTATLTGILSSDSPWIIPQTGVVTIAPGQTVTLTFQIDRSKRPDAAAPIGSVQGSLTLTFLSGQPAGKRAFDTTSTVPSVSLVKVVDTVQSAVSVGGIPALASGEVALFVPGVGHVTGTSGVQFASDVNLFNAQGSKSIDDLKLYYTSVSAGSTSAKSTALPSVAGQLSVAVADVVKNVFSGSNELGSLQIRSQSATSLNVAATVLTTNNATGTFGNTIPVFRSDRAADANGVIVLTGLRKDATTHTNLYVQETAGSPATAQIDFLDPAGSIVGSKSASIDPFKVAQMVDAVPANAVAAMLTNTSTAGGKIVAYATPVDQISSDTWAIADWSQTLGYLPGDPVVIPVAGSLHGANQTLYRTDVAFTNRGSGQASGTLRYVSGSGTKTDQQITLGGKQTNVISDVIGSLFATSGDTAGFLTFTPVTGSFAISSRTFTTTGSSGATFGTGVPALSAASALVTGGTRSIAGLSDASRTTILAARPGTFRTNFALMETTGVPVVVRVTFRFTFPAGAKAQGIGAASRDYSLNGYEFLLLKSIATEMLGVDRFQFGDLSNVQADFQIIGGNGSVVLFTSSVDNATGDSVLRTE